MNPETIRGLAKSAAVEIVHHPEIAVAVCQGGPDAVERLEKIIATIFEAGQRELIRNLPDPPIDFDDPSQDRLRAEEREAADEDRQRAMGRFF